MLRQNLLNYAGLFVLLAAFYAVGYIMASLGSFMIAPGVIGAILLLVTLLIFPQLRLKYYTSTMDLFKHFPFFVVPAGVGIMTSMVYFTAHPFLVLWVIFGSTLLSIIFTAFVVRLLISARHD